MIGTYRVPLPVRDMADPAEYPVSRFVLGGTPSPDPTAQSWVASENGKTGNAAPEPADRAKPPLFSVASDEGILGSSYGAARGSADEGKRTVPNLIINTSTTPEPEPAQSFAPERIVPASHSGDDDVQGFVGLYDFKGNDSCNCKCTVRTRAP